MANKENIEPLGHGVKVVVSDKHKFNMDTILLANFSSRKRGKNAIDLGTGCGTIALIWARDNIFNHITAVDIQKSAIDLLNKSVDLNHFNNRVSVYCDDICSLHNKFKNNRFDVVACNPPYKSVGSGGISKDGSSALARHEVKVTLNDIIKAASKLLNFSGSLFMCNRPERLCDVISTMRDYNIEPKRLRFVSQKINKAPKLFLIEGKLGAKNGLTVLPTLSVSDNEGNLSPEMKEIYIYREEAKNER